MEIKSLGKRWENKVCMWEERKTKKRSWIVFIRWHLSSLLPHWVLPLLTPCEANRNTVIFLGDCALLSCELLECWGPSISEDSQLPLFSVVIHNFILRALAGRGDTPHISAYLALFPLSEICTCPVPAFPISIIQGLPFMKPSLIWFLSQNHFIQLYFTVICALCLFPFLKFRFLFHQD